MPNQAFDFIVVGLGRFGGRLVTNLHAQGYRVLGIDFDPQIVRHWQSLGISVQHFDASDPDLFEVLPMSHGQWLVHTIPQPSRTWEDDPRIDLVHLLRERGFPGKIALTVASESEQERIGKICNPDKIFLPHRDAADAALSQLLRL